MMQKCRKHKQRCWVPGLTLDIEAIEDRDNEEDVIGKVGASNESSLIMKKKCAHALNGY